MARTPKEGSTRKKRSYRVNDEDHALLVRAAGSMGGSVPDLLHAWCGMIRKGDTIAAADLVGVLHQTEQQHG